MAENMHDQVDDDGNDVKIMDAIVDYKKNSNVVDKPCMCVRIKSGQQYLRCTTSDWSLLILLKNGEE